MKNLNNILLLCVLISITNSSTTTGNIRHGSCLEIHRANKNAKSGTYTIRTPGDEVHSVYCDMEANNGGWTKVSHIVHNEEKPKNTKDFAIDDLNINYREVMVRTADDHYLSYAVNGSWWDQGFSFLHNYLKFNNGHYYYLDVNYWRGCGGNAGFPHQVNHIWEKLVTYYIPSIYYRVTKGAPKCRAGNRNFPHLCAREFIVQAPGRLRGFGDLESIDWACTGDNRQHYNIEFFVR